MNPGLQLVLSVFPDAGVQLGSNPALGFVLLLPPQAAARMSTPQRESRMENRIFKAPCSWAALGRRVWQGIRCTALQLPKRGSRAGAIAPRASASYSRSCYACGGDAFGANR